MPRKGLGLLIGLILGTIIGAALVYLILKKFSGEKAAALENVELWRLWEDEDGIHAEVHRRVKPSG